MSGSGLSSLRLVRPNIPRDDVDVLASLWHIVQRNLRFVRQLFETIIHVVYLVSIIHEYIACMCDQVCGNPIEGSV